MNEDYQTTIKPGFDPEKTTHEMPSVVNINGATIPNPREAPEITDGYTICIYCLMFYHQASETHECPALLKTGEQKESWEIVVNYQHFLKLSFELRTKLRELWKKSKPMVTVRWVQQLGSRTPIGDSSHGTPANTQLNPALHPAGDD